MAPFWAHNLLTQSVAAREQCEASSNVPELSIDGCTQDTISQGTQVLAMREKYLTHLSRKLSSDDPGQLLESPDPERNDLYHGSGPILLPEVDRDRSQSRMNINRKALEKISEKRMDLLGIRVRCRELRTSWRHERDHINSNDAKLLQMLRNSILVPENTVGLQQVLEEFESNQVFVDKLRLTEDELISEEEELLRKEWALQELEQMLYDSAGTQISLPSDPELDSVEGDQLTRPFAAEYLSRLGDAHVIQERLSDLRAERALIAEDERRRAGVGLRLDEDTRAFLDAFDTRHSALLDELMIVEADVWRLREQLSSQSDSLFSTTQFGVSDWDKPNVHHLDDFMQDLSDSTGTSPDTILNDSFHETIRSFDGFSSLSFLGGTDCGEPTISTVRYINYWLLEQLRISSSNIRRLKSEAVLERLDIDNELFKDLLLEWWFKDSCCIKHVGSRMTDTSSIDLPIKQTSLPGTHDEFSEPDMRRFVLKRRGRNVRVPRDRSPGALSAPVRTACLVSATASQGGQSL